MGPLHDAVKSNLVDEVVRLLKQPGCLRTINSLNEEGQTALHIAADLGNAKIVDQLLASGAAIDSKSRGAHHNFTALCFAAHSGRLHIVDLLLAAGANVHAICKIQDADGYTPVILAGANRHYSVVKRLLAAASSKPSIVESERKSLLSTAIREHDDKLLELILEAGGPTVVWEKIKKTKRSACPRPAEKKCSWSALHDAAEVGNEAALALLLKHGASLDIKNQNGHTPLHTAISSSQGSFLRRLFALRPPTATWPQQDILREALGQATNHIGMMDVLLEAGVSPDSEIPESSLNLEEDESGMLGFGVDKFRLLHWAAANGNVEMIRKLIEKGANMNIKTSLGHTALHISALSRQAEATQVLLENGAQIMPTGSFTMKDPDTYHDWNVHNATPLHIAAAMGSIEDAKLLIEAGANVEQECSHEDYHYDLPGWNALHCAAVYNQLEMIRYLLECGANVNAIGRDGTALVMAASCCSLETVAALIESGADVNLIERFDNLELDIAMYFEYDDEVPSPENALYAAITSRKSPSRENKAASVARSKI